jgi:hypothetical protein
MIDMMIDMMAAAAEWHTAAACIAWLGGIFAKKTQRAYVLAHTNILTHTNNSAAGIERIVLCLLLAIASRCRVVTCAGGQTPHTASTGLQQMQRLQQSKLQRRQQRQQQLPSAAVAAAYAGATAATARSVGMGSTGTPWPTSGHLRTAGCTG